MPDRLTDASMRRRHRRRGLVSLCIAGFLGLAILAGWITAGWDPQYFVSGRHGGQPLWLASLWIGVVALGVGAFGIAQLRAAAVFRRGQRDG